MSTQQPLSYLTVSPDGYVRLTLEELRGIKLMHLISGVDQAMEMPASLATATVSCTGYTEWRSLGTPAISIGWDWEMTVQTEICHLRLCNHPRSNLMLIQASNRIDACQLENSNCLKDFVAQLAWQEEVCRFLAK